MVADETESHGHSVVPVIDRCSTGLFETGYRAPLTTCLSGGQSVLSSVSRPGWTQIIQY
jgi:hypothetical protein